MYICIFSKIALEWTVWKPHDKRGLWFFRFTATVFMEPIEGLAKYFLTSWRIPSYACCHLRLNECPSPIQAGISSSLSASVSLTSCVFLPRISGLPVYIPTHLNITGCLSCLKCPILHQSSFFLGLTSHSIHNPTLLIQSLPAPAPLTCLAWVFGPVCTCHCPMLPVFTVKTSASDKRKPVSLICLPKKCVWPHT